MTWAKWSDVPVGEQNWIAGQFDLFEQTIGFQIGITSANMLDLANAGVMTQRDIGQYALQHYPPAWQKLLQSMPWAQYGLDKDTYASMTGTFSTEYKKITGQDISKDALKEAFLNPRDPTGGLMTASQYAQQLMNDQSIQKTYGWVKYGMDFSQWTQQKLQLQSTFGRNVHDAEAATILQYTRASQGSNLTAIGRAAQQPQAPQTVGVGQSVVR